MLPDSTRLHLARAATRRQFLAGAVGVPEPWATRRETPLSHSLCRYVVRRGRPLMVAARQSLSERGAKGAQVDMTVEVPWSVSDRLTLRVAVAATWADRDHMQTYFGVTAAQAQATSFSVYTPKSGCRKVEAHVGAEYALAPSWKLQTDIGFAQLGDVAAASPLVGRRNSASAALAVAYGF